MEEVNLLFKKINLDKAIFFLLAIFLFLLPWQTRWIFNPAYLNDGFWEYGTRSLYGTEMLLWTIFVLFIINQIRQKTYRKIPLLHCFIASLFLLTVGLNVFQSSNPNVSLYFILRIVEGVGLCLVLSQINFSTNKLLFTFWFGGVVQGILAIVQFFTQEVWASKWLGMAAHLGSDLGAAVIETGEERWLRAYGSFGWPNSLGIYLAVVWVVGFVLYYRTSCHPERSGSDVAGGVTQSKDPLNNRGILQSCEPVCRQAGLPQNDKIKIQTSKWKTLITAGQLIILSGLILSFSRGAWIAAGIGVITLLLIIITMKQYNNEIMMFIQQLVYSTLIVVFFLATLFPLFTTRLNTTARLENRSVSERISQYTQAKNIITHNVWSGIGPGAYTFYLYKLNPSLAVWEYQPVHNIYLLIIAETGVVFLCFYVLVFSYLVNFIWKRHSLFLSIVVVLLVAGLFDHWLWSMYAGQILWWSVLGFGIKKLPEISPTQLSR